MAYPNGDTTQYTYYADNRLNTLANLRGGAYLSTFNYAYDGAGNMVAKLELKGTTSYVYDALGRIATVTEPDGKVAGYNYDAAGNRLTETVTLNNSVTITGYDYDEQGRLISSVETSDDAEKTTEFHYDNNGNQISRLVSVISDPDGSPAFGLSQPGEGTGDEITYELNSYDEFGQLITSQSNLYTATYAYNADGLRVSKEVVKDGIPTTTKFLYEGGNITLELDGAGNQTAYNVYGGDSPAITHGINMAKAGS